MKGLGQTPPHPTFPYAEGFVRETIAGNSLRGPRRVLAWFSLIGLAPAQEAAPPPAKAPRDVAREEYQRLREDIAKEGDRSPDESAAVVQGALATLLTGASSLAGAHVVRAARGRGKKSGIEVTLARDGKEASIYAEASNSRNGMAAKAAVMRLKESL